MDLNIGNGDSRNVWDLELEENVYSAEEDVEHCNHVEVSKVLKFSGSFCYIHIP